MTFHLSFLIAIYGFIFGMFIIGISPNILQALISLDHYLDKKKEACELREKELNQKINEEKNKL